MTDGWKVRWRAQAVNAAAGTVSTWSTWQQATIDVPDPPSGPAVSALQVVPSAVVGGIVTTSSLTPSLRAQVDDPAGGTLRADFEVEHDPAAPQDQGTGQIWAGSADNVTAGTQAVVNVPTGTLTDGWQVRWRARAVASSAASAWSAWQNVTIRTSGQPAAEPLARTVGPVLRTDQAFTISAWLRWNDKDGDYTVVEQKGTSKAPFRLGNDPEHGLVFTFTSDDSTSAISEGIVSEVEPPVNEWFHLVGTYDDVAKKVALYLNGEFVKESPISFTPWNAPTAMTLGTSMQGQLDDVQLFQDVLWPEHISTLAGKSEVKPTQKQENRSQPNKSSSPKILGDKAEPARVDWNFCTNLWGSDPGIKPVLAMSNFSACHTNQILNKYKVKQNKVKVTRGIQSVTLGVVANTYQNSRSVDVELHFWDIYKWGETAENPITLQVTPVGHPAQSNCALAPDSPTSSLLVTRTPVAWDADPVLKYRFSSPSTGTDSTFKISTCRVAIRMSFVSPAGTTHIERDGPIESYRCDTWTKNNWYKKGGCSFSRLAAILLLSRKDKDEKSGVTWPEQVDHIEKALTAPNTTIPKLGGPTYPESAGKSKDIPGLWNVEHSKMLHRLFDETDSEDNYEKSVKTCRDEIAKTWNADRKNHPDTAVNCDEFPMASTREGSYFARPPWNYSVQLINAVQNQTWGRKLKAWYRNHRVLPGDPFSISIVH
ncbi:LamG-like jellyroll fold domain-containing protein [Nonomuraea sp. NPDC000554]|uniref:LamG-like jellyroll fold domain-containing protein n=1 Tax=Nonomuraea sp. NPDC000554 TaxID=3154259 RepID=UPI003332F897